MENKELAELIKKEAIKLLMEATKNKMDRIADMYRDFTPSYPYGQFNKFPNASWHEYENDARALRNIYDINMEEYIEKNGRNGFVKVASNGVAFNENHNNEL